MVGMVVWGVMGVRMAWCWAHGPEKLKAKPGMFIGDQYFGGAEGWRSARLAILGVCRSSMSNTRHQ